MKKRILSSMIIIAMLFSAISAAVNPAPASATESKQARGKQAVTNEISVKGTTSAGEMVSKAIQTKQSEQAKNDGNNIYTVEVKGKNAAVSFETTQTCTLLVAIYNEAGTCMLASGKKEVSKEQNEAQITVETENMPKYFYLRAFLIDSKSLNPLCTAYESPNYTREMQEFFDMTTDDFKEDQVLNFDKDKANNFAVYDKDTNENRPKTKAIDGEHKFSPGISFEIKKAKMPGKLSLILETNFKYYLDKKYKYLELKLEASSGAEYQN